MTPIFRYALDEIEANNASLRKGRETDYPFARLVVFAQIGHQATYLATVPELGGAVLYLDDHEEPWALPIGIDIEHALAVLAALEVESIFDAPERFADERLAALVHRGAFDPFIRGDASVRAWIARAFG